MAATEEVKIPQKKDFRQRAHANVFTDHSFPYPIMPEAAQEEVDALYPKYAGTGAQVEFADIGCGYGGLLMALSPLFPDTLMIGMEIRNKVCEYVQEKIKALRVQNPDEYQNVACIRTNAQKFLPNYFRKGQLTKMFFLFPDPHFKAQKHRRRIITPTLLAEYAYVLREGGLLYTCTDVKDLHEWMVKHLDDHPLFVRLTDAELENDVTIEPVMRKTEEGIKVERNEGDKFLAVYRRIPA